MSLCRRPCCVYSRFCHSIRCLTIFSEVDGHCTGFIPNSLMICHFESSIRPWTVSKRENGSLTKNSRWVRTSENLSEPQRKWTKMNENERKWMKLNEPEKMCPPKGKRRRKKRRKRAKEKKKRHRIRSTKLDSNRFYSYIYIRISISFQFRVSLITFNHVQLHHYEISS